MKLKQTDKVVNETYFYEYEYKTGKKKRIDIIFKDGAFNCVHFTFVHPYTREQWEILHEIRQEICRIESTLKEGE